MIMKKIVPLLSLTVTTIALFAIALVLSPFDHPGVRINGLGRLWARIHLKVCGISVSLQGCENLPNSPYIIMCNHQGVLDIFALQASLRASFKWIAKKELFSIPFLGWILRMGKNIALDRENPRKALQAMREAARKIENGMNVVIFPEGTWGTGGTLLPFKKGGFSLAVRTGVPVVPVGIAGTGELQPEGCFVPLKKGRIVIKIGPPIKIADGETGKRERMMLEVRCHIEGLAGNGC